MISRNNFQSSKFYFFPHCAKQRFILIWQNCWRTQENFCTIESHKTVSFIFCSKTSPSQITPFLRLEAEFLLSHLRSFANSYFLLKTAPFILTVWRKKVDMAVKQQSEQTIFHLDFIVFLIEIAKQCCQLFYISSGCKKQKKHLQSVK